LGVAFIELIDFSGDASDTAQVLNSTVMIPTDEDLGLKFTILVDVWPPFVLELGLVNLVELVRYELFE